MSDTPLTPRYTEDEFARIYARELAAAQSTIAAQAKEIGELRIAAMKADPCWYERVAIQNAEISAQAKEIERLREDAKRYRWLRENAQLGNEEEPEKGPFIKMWWPDVPQNMNGYVWRAPTGEKLDARIDAEIDKEQSQ